MGIVEYLQRNLRRICLVFILAYSVVYAFAFVSLHFKEHPYHAASRWMLDNFRDKVRIVGPHWDDRLPSGVPEHPRYPSVFNYDGRENELPLYEPDTKAKVDMTLRRVSDADYIVFGTPRMADSLPRIPDEYPATVAFLRLLWGEKLGFKLIKTFKNRPTFLGFTFNDDLADESFSVYDHPKATIFENVERLPVEELRRRIEDAENLGPLPSMDEMLLMDEGGWVGKPSGNFGERIVPFVCAFFFVQLLAVGFWGTCIKLFRSLGDRGLGLSPLLGILAASGVSWALALFKVAPVNQLSVFVISTLLVALAVLEFASKRESRAAMIEALRRHGLRVEFGFLLGVLVVLVVLRADPQFMLLSEQVDGSYLQYFIRNETIPPVELLDPSQRMQGFYFDRYALGWFIKGVGVDGPIAVQICMVLIGGVVGAAVYSVSASLFRKPTVASMVAGVTAIPFVIGVLVLRESREAVPGVMAEQLQPSQRRLVRWLTDSVPGAPVAVDACLVGASSGLPRAAGIPAYQRVQQAGQSENLCGISDADGLFDSMMKYGASMYVITAAAASDPAAVKATATALEARPDLFAKVYDRDGMMVFAPAFSELYRVSTNS